MTTIENISITNPSPHECELTITMPGVLVTKEYENALRDIQRVAQRPGFRPGKMPRNMVQSIYGSEIKRNLVKKLMEMGLKEACETENLAPVSDPRLEALGECEREKAFTYKASFQKKPVIEVNKFEGLSVEVKKLSFSDKDIEDELLNLQESHATLAPPKDREEIGTNDFVLCDTEVFIGGVKKEEHGHKDYSVALFDSNVPQNVRDALLGKRLGETANLSYTIPEDHQEEDIKGKECVMHIFIKDFKERILPKLDDDFAKDLSDKFNNLDDLRESIRTRFTINSRRREEYLKQDAITRALVDNNPFDAPPALIERMALNLINRELESLPKSVAEDAIKNQWSAMWQSVQSHAQFRVKAQLIFEVLVKKLNIEASDDEIEQYMRNVKGAVREDAIYTVKIEKLLSAILKSSVVTTIEAPLFE